MYEVFLKLLAKKGVTTADVSRATGINQSTFANWKKRNNLLSGKNAKLVADYFDVSVDFLMTGLDIKVTTEWEAADASDLPAAIVLTDQEEELLGIFRYLSNKEELLKYARFLKEGEKARSKKVLDA